MSPTEPQVPTVVAGPPTGRRPDVDPRETLLAEAEAFLRLYYSERAPLDPFEKRWEEIRDEIDRTGTYWQTPEELAHGARVAWRNNARCIGRLYWETLQVVDQRDLETPEEMFEALVDHLRRATNGGKLKPMITILAPRAPGKPGIRIWNSQLIRYAGYRQPDGSVIGDPINADLTDAIRGLGWPGGEGTPFDILPLAIQLPNQPARYFELPRDAVLEVPISHPRLPWFAELGLKWHAVPAVSSMRLEVGGISYTAAPFNGWYMDTEIGVRNFGDADRYNMLPTIADRLGIDRRTDRSLWKDRALVELNQAVMHSFAAEGVSMVDHHTAARQFIHHEEKEKKAGRPMPANWSWIIPPTAASTTPVWPRPYKNFRTTPNYFNQRDPWRQG